MDVAVDIGSIATDEYRPMQYPSIHLDPTQVSVASQAHHPNRIAHPNML